MEKCKDGLKITVVTICYNEELSIEETLLSVINQTYSNIEYIVIDGGSKDRTVDVLRKYSNHFAYWVSEKDNGIYDAMNKGIMKSNGDYVCFINSGDSFVNSNVVSNIVKIIVEQQSLFDLVYGNLLLDNNRIFKPMPLEMLNVNMVFGHPTLFCKLSILKNKMFDLTFSISADYNFVVDCFLNHCTFLNSELLVSKYKGNGISSRNHIKRIIEVFRVQRKLGILRAINNVIITFSLILKNTIILTLKKIK